VLRQRGWASDLLEILAGSFLLDDLDLIRLLGCSLFEEVFTSQAILSRL